MNADQKTTPEGGVTAPPRAPKTFLQTVQDIHFGHTADELTTALQECIAASEKTGKATELVFKLKIRPKKAGSGRYEVLPDISTKLPPKEVEAMDMFVGPDGNLTTRDPRQPDLPGIRVVDKGPSRSEGTRLEDDEQQRDVVRI